MTPLYFKEKQMYISTCAFVFPFSGNEWRKWIFYCQRRNNLDSEIVIPILSAKISY